MSHPIAVILGPTAVGKTDIAIKLAKKINGEIISADSMQAYKGMTIISRRPRPAERKGIPHHLLGFLEPSCEYSAALFSKMAAFRIKKIIKKGKIPIITGGSGLYARALIDGIFPSKGKSEKIRKRLAGLAAKNGNLFLYGMLQKIDPLSAEKIHPNDMRRVIRALEIYELEKKTKTSLGEKTKGIKDEYEIKIFGLNMTRDALYERINKRTDCMFQEGAVKEVKRLLGKKLSITARKAIGITQIEGYLKQRYDTEKAKELLKRDTRRFAKRQLTWFRADKRIRWLDIGKMGEKRVLDIMASRLTGM
ncbi:MAG: tRNA (adenosine(37)-N6)-dimethylallyltransferase MiaA [Candidatus Omnitrophica bacterium]|nr:tRNA (adenosine(37)-N6)-dimethylallyltransferase MiaA [Candidatus Omnitrophota bacterium]